jgi:hypothetical protein
MATRQTKLTKLTILTLIACFALFVASPAPSSAGVVVGLNVGIAPPVAPVEVVAPCPGPGYAWVAGHWGWYPGVGYRWARGVWVRPPFAHAAWIGPRYVAGPHGRVFYRGYWRR